MTLLILLRPLQKPLPNIPLCSSGRKTKKNIGSLLTTLWTVCMYVCRHYYSNVGFSKNGAQCSCKLALLAGFENYTLYYTYYTLHSKHNTHYTCYTLHTTHYTLKILDVKYTLNTTHYTFKWNITTHTTHTKHYTLHTTHITHYTYYTLYTKQVHTKH